MITGLVEAAGQVCGQALLMAPAGVFIELTAGHGCAGLGLVSGKGCGHLAKSG